MSYVVNIYDVNSVNRPGHTFVVVAVEAAQRVAVEVGADGGRLVRAVAAVVRAVAQVQLRHAQVVGALESVENFNI